MNRYEELKLAEKGAIVSIFAYIFLSIIKLIIGNWAHSVALSADGMNNITDVIGSVMILIGLRLARKPADRDHAYGHWKMETVASLVTSFIMLTIGFEVLGSAVEKIVNKSYSKPEPFSAFVGFFAAMVMFGVYFYNSKLAKKLNSGALKAAAKDNLSDAYTSIGTTVAIVASGLKFQLLDTLAAMIIAGLILKTAIDIFKESAFSLSDGFSEEWLVDYEKLIMEISGVKSVRTVRGRMYGANIFLNVVVAMDPMLTVIQSHYITEVIEKRLSDEFGVYDTEIHVEPYFLKQSKKKG